MKTCPECGKILNNQNNKFCNSSCAASFNNKKKPKRTVEGSCRACQNPIPTRKAWCSDFCRKKDLDSNLKNCSSCGKPRPETDYYRNNGTRRSDCKACFNKLASKRVVESRRNKKKKLVESHGSQCADCGLQGPSYIFDFDHREPENKSFGIAENMNKLSFDDLYQETLKCDLVCALCHRYRTHLQRCSGCDDCRKEIKRAM